VKERRRELEGRGRVQKGKIGRVKERRRESERE